MPYYNFFNTKTDEYFSEFFQGWRDAEKYVEENPHINWLCSAVGIVDPVKLGRKKPDDGFRDVLKTIKKGSPRSDINTF